MENEMTPERALEKIKKHRYLHTVATMAGYVEEETNVGRELKQECKIIDQALTELEETKILCESFKNDVNRLNEQCTNLHLKDKKQTQILEVLKNKEVDITFIKYSNSCEYYNKYVSKYKQLTETEFNLIKEWLK